MSKVEFLALLEAKMMDIPQLEKERIMNYYNETIEDAIEDGVSEEQAIARLGTMDDIIKQIYMEHDIKTSPSKDKKETRPYARYILLCITSPFWLTIISFVITMYLLYLTVILIIVVSLLASIIFFISGCFNIVRILLANSASGVVLLGCMLISLGMLPLLYRLLIQSVRYAKVLYHKGIDKGKSYWRKVVA